MPIGFPDFYKLVTVEKGIQDIRGISPLGYRQSTFWYGHTLDKILSQEKFHSRVLVTYSLSPAKADTWYSWETDEIFDANILLLTALLGQIVVGFACYLKVSASGQQMSIKPWMKLYKGDTAFKTITGYTNSWDETVYTLKRSSGSDYLIEAVILDVSTKLRARLGFDYLTTVADSAANFYFGKDAYNEENYLLLPIRVEEAR